VIPIGIVRLFLEVVIEIVIKIVEIALLFLKWIVERTVVVAVVVVVARTGSRNDWDSRPPQKGVLVTSTGISAGEKCCGEKHVRFS